MTAAVPLATCIGKYLGVFIAPAGSIGCDAVYEAVGAMAKKGNLYRHDRPYAWVKVFSNGVAVQLLGTKQLYASFYKIYQTHIAKAWKYGEHIDLFVLVMPLTPSRLLSLIIECRDEKAAVSLENACYFAYRNRQGWRHEIPHRSELLKQADATFTQIKAEGSVWPRFLPPRSPTIIHGDRLPPLLRQNYLVPAEIINHRVRYDSPSVTGRYVNNPMLSQAVVPASGRHASVEAYYGYDALSHPYYFSQPLHVYTDTESSVYEMQANGLTTPNLHYKTASVVGVQDSPFDGHAYYNVPRLLYDPNTTYNNTYIMYHLPSSNGFGNDGESFEELQWVESTSQPPEAAAYDTRDTKTSFSVYSTQRPSASDSEVRLDHAGRVHSKKKSHGDILKIMKARQIDAPDAVLATDVSDQRAVQDFNSRVKVSRLETIEKNMYFDDDSSPAMI